MSYSQQSVRDLESRYRKLIQQSEGVLVTLQNLIKTGGVPTGSSGGGITATSADRFKNKRISGTENTLSDIPLTGVTGLQDALNGKLSADSPSFNGTISLPSATSIGNVNAIEISYLDGATSNLQQQINARQLTLTYDAAPVSGSQNVVRSGGVFTALAGKAPLDSPSFTGTVILPSTTGIGNVSAAELSYLDGVTSSIQAQLNGKAAAGSGSGGAPTDSPTFTGNVSLPATTTIGTVSAAELGYLDGATSNLQAQINAKQAALSFDATPTSSSQNVVRSAGIFTALAAKAPIDSPTFTGTATLPATTSIGNVSAAEIGFLDGVTAAIQTQFTNILTALGLKANADAPTFTGVVTLPATTSIGTVTSTEIGFLDGVTSAIQTQIANLLTVLGLKANSASPTFTGTVSLPATTSIGTVSAAELGYLDGVTSSIQTQLDSKGSGSGGNITYTNVAALRAATPANGTIAYTAGYYTPGDGGGGEFIYNSTSTATQDNGTVITPTSGTGRWLAIINAVEGVYPRLFGAKGKQSPIEDDAAFVAMAKFVRDIAQANINGTQDARFPIGVSIQLGHGSYTTTTPFPLFSGLKLYGTGYVANENANITKWTYAGASGTTLFVYNELANTYNGGDIDDITIQGIGFNGKQDMTTGVVPPFSQGGQSQIRNSTIQFNGFRYFKKIDMFLILVDFRNNYFNFMPQGCLMLGASDCDIISNKFGGGGYDANGTRYQAANKFVRVVELQSFGNSRFNNNYISGDFSTSTRPSPIPLYIENSHTSQFSDNWYDYSDGPNIQMRYCYNLEFRGGNLQGSNRFNSLTNQYGGEGYGENECAIFIGNSDRISIDNMVFKEIPVPGNSNYTTNQCTVRTWGCTNIDISDYSVGRIDPLNTSQPFYIFTLVAENGSVNVTANALGFKRSKRNIVSSTATLTLQPIEAFYSYTGTTAATWTDIPLAGNASVEHVLVNAGTGTLTVNSATGANDYYMAGVKSNNFVLMPGESCEKFNNSISWIVRGQ